MALIRPCADLRNCYNEISKSYPKEKEENKKTNDFSYTSFEEFQKYVFKIIEQAFKDIEDRKYCAMEEATLELEEKYGLSKQQKV